MGLDASHFWTFSTVLTVTLRVTGHWSAEIMSLGENKFELQNVDVIGVSDAAVVKDGMSRTGSLHSSELRSDWLTTHLIACSSDARPF